VVERTQLEWIAEHGSQAAPRALASGRFGADELPDSLLVGTYPLECDSRGPFRWTEPIFALRLASGSGPRQIAIETRGTRGSPLDFLVAAYVDDRPLRPELMAQDSGRLILKLPSDGPTSSAARVVTLVCRPLLPHRQGSSDRRRLGMPISSLELSDAP
jgi:hypothetical protein